MKKHTISILSAPILSIAALPFGDGSGSLRADSAVTRDQGAVILYRYCATGAALV